MEKVAPNSNLLGILLKIILQSKIKGTLAMLAPKIESSDRDWCFYGKDQISIRV